MLELICMGTIVTKGRVQRAATVSVGPLLETYLPPSLPHSRSRTLPTAETPASCLEGHRENTFILVSLAPNTVPDSGDSTTRGHTWHVSSGLIAPGLWPWPWQHPNRETKREQGRYWVGNLAPAALGDERQATQMNTKT